VKSDQCSIPNVQFPSDRNSELGIERWSDFSVSLSLMKLATRLRHGHDFKEVTARVLEVKAAPAVASIDLHVSVTERTAAIRQVLRLHTLENCIELRVADMKRIVIVLAWLDFVREIQRQTIVDLHLLEVSVVNLQAEHFSKKFC
jgi:hypothetical protein